MASLAALIWAHGVRFYPISQDDYQLRIFAACGKVSALAFAGSRFRPTSTFYFASPVPFAFASGLTREGHF